MANIIQLYNMKTPELNPIVIAGSFNRASDETITVLEGKRFTVARTSAGLYTVTLLDPYSALIYANANILATTAVNTICAIDAESVTTAGGGTIGINTYEVNETDGTADMLDIPHTTTDATARLMFIFVLRNSRI